MRDVVREAMRFCPPTSASRKRTSMDLGRSIKEMRMLKPDRASRWKRPRRSITMTSAWPTILNELVKTNSAKSAKMPIRMRPNIATPGGTALIVRLGGECGNEKAQMSDRRAATPREMQIHHRVGPDFHSYGC